MKKNYIILIFFIISLLLFSNCTNKLKKPDYSSQPTLSKDLLKLSPDEVRELDKIKKEVRELMERDRYKTALNILNKAIKKFPRQPDLYLMRAKCLIETVESIADNHNKIEDNYNKAVKLGGGEKAYIARADFFYMSRQYNRAIIDCKKAMKMNPKNPEPYIILATIYKDEDNSARVLENLTKAIKIAPDEALGYSLRGAWYYKLPGHFKESRKDLEKALSKDDTDFFALYYLGSLYNKQIDYKNALKIYKKALKLSGNNQWKKLNKKHDLYSLRGWGIPADINIVMADVYDQMNDVKSALEVIEKMKGVKGMTGLLMHPEKGYLLQKLGRNKDALKEYKQFFAKKPGKSMRMDNAGKRFYYEMEGRSYEALGQYKDALDSYIRLQEIHPDEDFNSMYLQGKVLYKMSKEEQARAFYRKIDNIGENRFGAAYKKDPFIRSLRGVIGTVLGKYDKALPLLNETLKSQPHNAELLYFRAVCNFNLGNKEQAKKDLDKVIQKETEKPSLKKAKALREKIEK
ncbi:MAG: tetratricopeptide repeat protein [Candidatus Eremiobacteraeota bacterium]|nr:tetratricopeptide repeat protein [Candidatus Eremiobacteraeota bacterium]